MIDWFYDVLVFFERGGMVMWSILFASLLLWYFLFERYWFLFFELEPHKKQVIQRWIKFSAYGCANADYLRGFMLRTFEAPLKNHLPLITTLVEILPLLGLLGTISGMIKVFDVITVFGAGNARGMASGISEALITTMAGLVTALSGLYLSAHLKAKSAKQSESFEMLLKKNRATAVQTEKSLGGVKDEASA